MFKRIFAVTFLIAVGVILYFSLEHENVETAYETSYNCTKADKFTELAICYDKQLAALDIELSETYKKTLAVNTPIDPSQKEKLKSSQLKWLKFLQSSCQKVDGEIPQKPSQRTVSCISSKYQKRIVDLVNMRLGGLKINNVSFDLEQALSKACFYFNHSLKNKQKLPLRSYINIEPSVDYSAKIEKGKLCLSGLPHSSVAKITLREGLISSSGDMLTEDVWREVKIGSRPQSITLGSKNYILPKTNDPFLPIKTVNYSSVDLVFYKVSEHDLSVPLRSERLGKQMRRAWHNRDIGYTREEQVWSGTLDIKYIQDQEVITQIPVKDMVENFQPGVYVLAAKPAGLKPRQTDTRTTQWVVVTDLGLSVYKGEKAVSVQTRSLKTAYPLGNISVQLVDLRGNELARGETSADGWVEFAPALFLGSGNRRPLFITAQSQQGDFSFISLKQPALDLSDHGISGKKPSGPVQTFLYSDRGIYRPGETVKLGYLLRNDLTFAENSLPVTLKVYRPDGKEVYKFVEKPDELGGGRLDVVIPNASPTGKWRFAAYSNPHGSAIGELSIQVEEFVPERLEVKAAPTEEKLKLGEPGELSVQADYLFGAPGSGLKIKGTAFLEVDRKPFKQYAKFYFGIKEDKAQHLKKLEEILSDENGKGVLEIPAFRDMDLSSPLKVRAEIEVMDTDGRPNRTKLQMPVFKHETLIGLRSVFDGKTLDYNEDANFVSIAVNANGEPLVSRELSVEWVREDRDYNWYYERNRWKSSYQKYDELLHRETLTTAQDGTIKFKRRFDRWGYYRAIVTDEETGAAADFTFRVGWWTNVQSPDTPDALELSVAETDVASGEEIKGFIKAPFSGTALITIAQKSLIWRKEIPLPIEGKEFTIPVQKEWGHGAYVLVTAYRPGMQKDQRGPGRAVGTKWISFGKDQRTLSVDFDLPDEILPSSNISVPFQVSGTALNSEKVKVNIFAVDEGILRLTGYKPPRADKFLLAQQKLQLAYHDVYGHLIASQKGERGNIRSGGDISIDGNTGGLSTRVFKTVALTSETLDIDRSGRGVVTFEVPDFNGRLRFFAVVYSKSATGGGEDTLLVRSPVVADLLPSRFLAPGDKAHFAFRLQNINGPEGTYHVNLSSTEPVFVENPNWEVESQTGERAETRFSVIANGIGKSKLALNVTGPDGYAQTREWDIEVRPAQQWVTTNKKLELSQSNAYTIDPSIFDNFLPETAHLNLTLSSTPELDVQKLVTALDRYPYGCLEQTTSRVFPLLSFFKVKEAWSDIQFDKENLSDKIDQGIYRILAKQRTDGSFGLWSRHSAVEPWLTAYAMDFLTEAREQGYSVLDGPFYSALDWMENAVARNRYGVDARSYMLLVLAKNDRYSTSNFKYKYNRLFQNNRSSSLARAQIIAAGKLKGIETSDLIINEVQNRINISDGYYSSYGSRLRDYAAILSLPRDIFSSEKERFSTLQDLFELAENKRYTSTQEKGWLLQAAAKIAEETSNGIKVQINGQKMQRDQTYRTQLTLDRFTEPYRVENMQDEPLSLRYSFTGIPKEPMAEEADGLSISREILDMNGKPASLDHVRTGDTFIILINGASYEPVKHKALIADLLPAGFEIETNVFNKDLLAHLGMNTDDFSRTTFKAERDDRFVAAVNLSARRNGDAFKLGYVVRAVTPGEYVYPAPFVEDMYKPEYFARGAMSNLTIHAAD